MGSPRRIFRYATLTEVRAAHAAALDRLTNGAFTNLSGEGKSSSRQFTDSQDILDEAAFELAFREGKTGPSQTTADFTGKRENNTNVDV